MAFSQIFVPALTLFKRCGLHFWGRTSPMCLLRYHYNHHGNPLERRNNSSVMPRDLSSFGRKWIFECSHSTCHQQSRLGAAIMCLHMSQRRYSQPPWQVWPFGKLDQPKKKDFKEPTSSSVVSVQDLDAHAMIYLERLHDAETPPEVLAVLQEGGHDLNLVHYGRALGRLADIYHSKKQEEGLVRSTMAPVLYDSRFRHLCHIVLQQSRHLENDLYIDTLEALQRLKIPLKSSMMYTFLVQAEQRVNTFSAADLAQFAGILSRYDRKNPRVQALVDAVSILTPRHIGDLRTLHHTLILIRVVGSSLDCVSRGKLANMLLAILAADEERSLEHITQAVLSLHNMNYKLDILLELACPVLTQNMPDLSDTDLYNLLCAFSGLCHADQNFFQAASQRILEDIDKWSPLWLINVAEAFNVVEIQAPLLLDCIIRRVMDSGVKNINLMSMTKLICSLVGLGHRPPSSWDFENFVSRATSSLVLDTSRLSSIDCRTVLTLTQSLATIGYFPRDLWQLLTSRKFANWFMMVKDGKEYKSMVRDIKSLTQLLKDNQQDSATVWAESIEKLIPLQ